jgi:tetratricopeptide (TPR) repeat protein
MSFSSAVSTRSSSSLVSQSASSTSSTTPSTIAENTTTTATTTTTAVSPYSTIAADCISQGNYAQAIQLVKQALEEYTQMENPCLVEWCNAAATLFNLGALSKNMQNYEEAVQYWEKAEELYRRCVLRLSNYPPALSSALAALEEERQHPHPSVISVCLIQLIAETLQTRGHLHFKYQDSVDLAVTCHQQVVALLDDTTTTENVARMVQNQIVVLPISEKERLELLSSSLQHLGRFYVMKEEWEDGLGAYQEALLVLRQLQSPCSEKQSPQQHQENRQQIRSVLKSLSSIYLRLDQLDRAVAAMHDAMNLQMVVVAESSDSSPHSPVYEYDADAIAVMQQLGQEKEHLGRWDSACECYEHVLTVQVKCLGPNHVQVAHSLVTLGKVMEQQGNPDGSLDLFLAAYDIYTPGTRASHELVLQMAQLYMAQNRASEAIDCLAKSLQRETTATTGINNSFSSNSSREADDDEEQEEDVHAALTYRELGRAHIALQEYGKASQCLVKSARLFEAIPSCQEQDEQELQIFDLLQRVEFLQRMDEYNDAPSYSSSQTRTILLPISEEKQNTKERRLGRKAANNMMNTLSKPPSAPSHYVSSSSRSPKPTVSDDDDDDEQQRHNHNHNHNTFDESSSHLIVTEMSTSFESATTTTSLPAAEHVHADLEFADDYNSEHVYVDLELEEGDHNKDNNSSSSSLLGVNDTLSTTRRDELAEIVDTTPGTSMSLLAAAQNLPLPPSNMEQQQQHDSAWPEDEGTGTFVAAETTRLFDQGRNKDVGGDVSSLAKSGTILSSTIDSHTSSSSVGVPLSKSTQSTEQSSDSGEAVLATITATTKSHTTTTATTLSPKNSSTQASFPYPIQDLVVASPELASAASLTSSSRRSSFGSISDGSDQDRFSGGSDGGSKDTSKIAQLIQKGDSLVETESASLTTTDNNDTREQAPARRSKNGGDTSNTNRMECVEVTGGKQRSYIPKLLPIPGDGSLSSGSSTLRSSSPSPVMSDHSRTGLLIPESNDGKPPPSAASSSKALRIPTLNSPRNAYSSNRKERREYTKMNAAPRNRFVKLSSPFRRSNKRHGGPNGNYLGALDEEDKQVPIRHSQVPPSPRSGIVANQELAPKLPDDSFNNTPIDFISLRSKPSCDDDMSQLTFTIEQSGSRPSNHEGQWWWGVTAEGLEGWFPSSYVNQAVEVAEGFLSAKSIHDREVSRPLDFDSDGESEVGDGNDSLGRWLGGPEDSKKPSSQHSKPPKLPSQAGAQGSRKGDEELLASFTSSRDEGKSSASGNAMAPVNSESIKKQNLQAELLANSQILENQQMELGQENVAVAATLFTLSVLHGKNNDTAAAVECIVENLRIQKAIGNLAEAARSLHSLADVYSRQRQFKSALSCYSEAHRLQLSIFGYYHEEVANTLNRIGNVHAHQGEFDKAMENHKEALRILKECFGEEVKNPMVSQTLIQIGAVYYKERNSLASIQSNTDDYDAFIEGGMLEVIGKAHENRGSYRMAIAFFEEKLQFLGDTDDLEHAETYNSLGMLSCRAGLYMEAMDFYDRALGIQMKLGCDKVQLAMARVLTGSVQYYLGHFEKALILFQDALVILQFQVGREHETVAATLFQMGLVKAALCEYDSAMEVFHEAFAIQNRLLGQDHPATLRTRREVGNMYAIYESEIASAFDQFDEVLETQKQIHGDKHPNVAETLHSIGCAQVRKRDFAAALKTLEGCYKMRLEFLGMDHPLQATTLHEIAKLMLKRGRIKKAIHICDAALNIRIESLSDRHIDVAIAMTTKASCLVALGSYIEAAKIFDEALSMAEEAVGSSHPAVADIYIHVGLMRLRKCHFDEAREIIQKALDMYRKSMDEDYPGIREALADLERVERAEMLCV